MAKLLVVAPVPTHPSTTGASARVRYMADALRRLGHEVHFFHLQQPFWLDDRALREAWGSRLHVFRSRTPRSFLGRSRRKLVRVTGKVLHLDLPVDSYHDPEAADALARLVHADGFDGVILSYVFYSKLFEAVARPARRILDTHDVFSDRFRLYRQHGQANEFFSTKRPEEARALDRADAIVAIQGWDAGHFRSLTQRPVVVVGHLAPLAAELAGVAVPPVILFVGGPMGINVHGMTWFIDEVFPIVRRRVPDAELWLAGGVGARIRSSTAGVRRLGFVETLGTVYRQARVVINPQRFGTGLSIKSVDALLHGRPLVSTPAGARGLEDGAGVAFRQSSDGEQFAADLIELLVDPAAAGALADRAVAFALAYYDRNLQALARVVSTPEGSAS
jgi:glycosyltransferase involved in cell wall biosynthesis